MEISKLKNILEAVLLAAERTLTVVQMEALFELDEERPTRDEIRKALHEMVADNAERGYEVKEVASGYRLQVKQAFATWVGRLWEEKPARYTRALLETMALIAYRQPITRGEIEEVRGVSVSSNIIKTLLERDWIKVLGHKDVPGKPTLYGTTKGFLDYFNLKKLDELPTLAEIKDLDTIHPELELDEDVPADHEQSETDSDMTENKDDDTENKVDDETGSEPEMEAATTEVNTDDAGAENSELQMQEQDISDQQSAQAEQDEPDESDNNASRQASNV